MLNLLRGWFTALDRTATSMLEYSKDLNDYRCESYTDLDLLSMSKE